jgi:hypothetical protein
MAASEESLALQTAPLCPWKVPTQSPVEASRSIGSLSRHAEMKKTPSALGTLYDSSTIALE